MADSTRTRPIFLILQTKLCFTELKYFSIKKEESIYISLQIKHFLIYLIKCNNKEKSFLSCGFFIISNNSDSILENFLFNFVSNISSLFCIKQWNVFFCCIDYNFFFVRRLLKRIVY